MAPLPNGFLDAVILICLVTDDLDGAVRRYADELGVGPWAVFDFAPPLQRATKIDGVSCDYTMRVAFGSIGGMAWALLEPGTGPTIYARFLARGGPGVHHLAFSHEGLSHTQCIREFARRGYPATQEGDWCGHYCYFATESATQLTLELIERPDARLPEPAYRRPAQAAGAGLAEGLRGGPLSLGIVTGDLDASLRAYADDLGIGPWAIYERKGGHAVGVARRGLAFVGSFLLELIEPDGTASPYHATLARRGGSVHHVGFGSSPPGYEAHLAAFRARGFAARAEDWLGGRRSSHLATEEAGGTVFRLFEGPDFAALPEPDRCYPARAAGP